MEKHKTKKISFNVSGTKGITPKLTLPRKWVEDMEITIEEREVDLKYDKKNKRIIITKHEE